MDGHSSGGVVRVGCELSWQWGAAVISSPHVLVLDDNRETLWRKTASGPGRISDCLCQLSLFLWLRPTSGVPWKS